MFLECNFGEFMSCGSFFSFCVCGGFWDGPSFASPVVGRANSVGTIWVPQRHRCVRST